MSERADAVNNAPSGGVGQGSLAHATVAPRIHCKREACGRLIPEPRLNKDFCSGTCRAENSHEERGVRARRRARGKKPQQSAATPTRRQTKDGDGTRLYVVRGEVELVRDLLAGRRPKAREARASLAAKIPAALKRIDRRAA